MSICSLDFVVVVVFEGTVVLVTGETVEACIFSNDLQKQKKENHFSQLDSFCRLD